MTTSRLGLTCAFALLAAFGSRSASAQWLQWGGPKRDFTSDAKGLKDKWPEDGPKKLWTRDLGDGYSTVVVDGDMLFVTYRQGNDELVAGLEAKTGKTLWEHKNPSPFTKTMEEFGPGPHATPLVIGDRLYTVGALMDFICFDKKTGKVLWNHDLVEEFGAKVPEYGYACSPVEYKGNIILPVGGKDDQGLMAFNKDSGSMIWKNQTFEISYPSPLIIKFEGEDQLVYFTGKALMGFNPNNGETLWSHPHATQYDANLMTPFYNGKDMLFCSAAYDSGAQVVKLSKKDGKTVPEQLWFSKKFRVHHGNAIAIGDFVYGSSGDFGPAFFMAMNMKTGEIAWRERGFKKATFVAADGKIILLDEDGQLALAKATPEGFNLLSKVKIAEPYAWAAPTLVGKTLYVRDRKHLWAFDLG